jgi:hypothetical protein
LANQSRIDIRICRESRGRAAMGNVIGQSVS